MNQTTHRRVAVVTDSSAYPPPKLVEKYDIHVVPLVLMMGERTWRDGVDIDPPAFYELLRASDDLPTSSQPSVATFEDLFVELSQEADGIVAILLSEQLSGTLDSARAAAARLPDIPIQLIDSRGCSMMTGFPVLEAAKAAAAGQDLETVADAARALIGRIHMYFIVDTLEYLHRGGRIGTAAKLLGSALDLKPLLQVKDGIVQAVTKVRTRKKALGELYRLVDGHLAKGDKVHMAVFNVAAPEEATRLSRQLEARFHPVEMIQTECSPVMGAHGGPGMVGVVFYAE
ncbi:MAG: DegV family protein [Chloroflexota bacterium]